MTWCQLATPQISHIPSCVPQVSYHHPWCQAMPTSSWLLLKSHITHLVFLRYPTIIHGVRQCRLPVGRSSNLIYPILCYSGILPSPMVSGSANFQLAAPQISYIPSCVRQVSYHHPWYQAESTSSWPLLKSHISHLVLLRYPTITHHWLPVGHSSNLIYPILCYSGILPSPMVSGSANFKLAAPQISYIPSCVRQVSYHHPWYQAESTFSWPLLKSHISHLVLLRYPTITHHWLPVGHSSNLIYPILCYSGILPSPMVSGSANFQLATPQFSYIPSCVPQVSYHHPWCQAVPTSSWLLLKSHISHLVFLRYPTITHGVGQCQLPVGRSSNLIYPILCSSGILPSPMVSGSADFQLAAPQISYIPSCVPQVSYHHPWCQAVPTSSCPLLKSHISHLVFLRYPTITHGVRQCQLPVVRSSNIIYPILCSSGILPSPMVSGSADFQLAAPQISQLLENIHASRQHLNQLWHMKKMKLEQCFQLRLFEQDVEKVGSNECGWERRVFTRNRKLFEYKGDIKAM